MSYRYLGNKTKLADWIVSEISNVLPMGSSIADPMCGTASVSIALARAGFAVTAADALTFPVLHAKARLLAKHPPPFEYFGGYQSAIQWMNSIKPIKGFFYREFGSEGSPENGRASRLYFSSENAAQIDGLREAIRSLRENNALSEIEHSVLLHHLILSTNKVANISGTYGYFRAKLSDQSTKKITFDPLVFENTPEHHTVVQGNVEKLASTFNTDAVYLDPPYTKRQYAGIYHVLETIAMEDEPEAIGDGGLRPWNEKASSFCYKKTAPSAFREALSNMNSPHIFISYSDDGQVLPPDLFLLLSEFGKVSSSEQPHTRYRSNSKVRKGEVTERLYHVEMY